MQVYPQEKGRLGIAVVVSALCWAGLAWLLQEKLLALVLGFAVLHLCRQSAALARLRGSGVQVGALQMQDLNGHLLAACRRLHVDHPPELYLVHEPAGKGARSLSFFGSDMVVLPAALVEALDALPGAIDFHIGRELARLRRRQPLWRLLLLPARVLPLLGPALSRAWEYTCDRHGLAACENPAYARVALAALACGASWKKLNLRSYQEQAAAGSGFWVSYHGLVCGMPALSRRMAAVTALADRQEPVFPRRHALAFMPALVTPGWPGAAAAIFLLALAALAGLAALPALHEHRQRAAVAAAFAHTADLRAAIERRAALQLRLPTLAEVEAGPSTFAQAGVLVSVVPQEGGLIDFSFEGRRLSARMQAYPVALEGNLRALQWHCAGTLAERLRPPGCAWDGEMPVLPVPAPSAGTPPVATTAESAAAAPAPAPATAIATVAPAASVSPAMLRFNRQMLGRALSAASALQSLVSGHHRQHRRWPGTLEELDYRVPVISLDDQGAVEAVVALGAAGQINLQLAGGTLSGGSLALKPRRKGDDYEWTCTASALAPDYLPDGCR